MPRYGLTSVTGGYPTSPMYSYWMYLVISEYFENLRQIGDFVQLIINFGNNLADKANVNVPLTGSYSTTRRDVLRLPWNRETWEELDRAKDPFLLITRKPFSSFKPLSDEFITIRFPEAFSNAAQYVEILDEIARQIKSGANLFQWRNRNRKSVGFHQRIFEAIEAKPGAFGFSVDLKKLLPQKS